MNSDPCRWPVIGDRLAYISELASGKDVLDIGCTGTRADGSVPDLASSLHRALRGTSASLIGVDIDPDGVRLMQENGYDVRCGDITTLALGRTFDLIVAGEIVEHLRRPGQALKNLHGHLRPDGRLVLTTPNPFCNRQQARIWKRGRIKVHAEHTAWYDPQTLSVMLRGAGFEVAGGVWIRSPRRVNLLTALACWRRYWNPNFLVLAAPLQGQ